MPRSLPGLTVTVISKVLVTPITSVEGVVLSINVLLVIPSNVPSTVKSVLVIEVTSISPDAIGLKVAARSSVS